MLTSLSSDIQRKSKEQDLKDRLWHKGSTPIKINVFEKYFEVARYISKIPLLTLTLLTVTL
jgi:hypothetical protein